MIISSDPVLAAAQSALAGAVARSAAVSLSFARSERWQRLVDSLAALGEAFDFLELLPIRRSDPEAAVDFDPEALGERVAEILDDVLRTDGLLEESAGDTRTFLVGARSVRDLPGGGDLADAIEDLQLRIRVATAAAGHVDLAFFVGVERVQIALLHVDADGASVETDLAGLRRALELVGLVLLRRFRDPRTAPFALPDIDGRVRAELSFAGTNTFRFALELVQSLGLVFRAGGRPYGLAIQPSTDTVSVAGDAAAGDLELALSLGRVSFAFASLASGVAELVLPGLSCRLGFAENQSTLRIDELGIGPSAAILQLDGQHLATWDVNEGSELAVELTPLPNERAVSVSVEPECKLRVALNLGSVSEELGWPESVVTDSVEIRFAGSADLGTAGATVRSGNLTVVSKNAGAVNAAAGQTVRLCTAEAGDHPVRRLVVD